MDSSPKKSRKRALSLAVLILILLFLSVFGLRDKLFSRSVHRALPPNDSEASSESDVLMPAAITNNTQQALLAAADLPAAPTTHASESVDNSNSRSKGAIISNISSAPFAVVDLKRIFAVHEAQASSPETRSNLLVKIKGLVTTHARSRGFKLVIDVSAQGLNAPIFMTPTNGLPDLTDSVLKELSH